MIRPWSILPPLLGLLLAACMSGAAPSDEASARLPAPRLDPAPAQPGEQVAVFAGGCFWCPQSFF